MASIRIPLPFVSGFKLISKLTKNQAELISNTLNQANFSGDDTVDKLKSQLPEISNSISNIVRTIESIWGLRNSVEVETDLLINDLATNYAEVESISKKDIENLKNNLSILIYQSEEQKLQVKARDLLTEFDKIFLDSRVISDIRTVFNDNINDKKQQAIIIHNLKIDYRQNNDRKSSYFALDINDLHNLKKQIERAIEKEMLMKKTEYSSNLTFISLNTE